MGNKWENRRREGFTGTNVFLDLGFEEWGKFSKAKIVK